MFSNLLQVIVLHLNVIYMKLYNQKENEISNVKICIMRAVSLWWVLIVLHVAPADDLQ